jgi:hypothetical protein
MLQAPKLLPARYRHGTKISQPFLQSRLLASVAALEKLHDLVMEVICSDHCHWRVAAVNK